MPIDRSFVALNRGATARMRTVAERLSDEELRHPVGQHWTVAIVYAHLALLDSRALYVLDATERAGQLVNPDYDVFVNGISLPLWQVIPPREAVRVALETAEALDRRLEAYPEDLLELIHAEYQRYVFRTYHRTEHLDEAEAALKGVRPPAA